MFKSVLIALITCSFFLLISLALAQEAVPNTATPTPSPVEYTLPYPGLLPNHPLYIIKNIRDTILSLLISDPVKKVQFHQLLAEKDLNAGIFLLNKGNSQLAVTMFTKGKKNLDLTYKYIFEIPGTKAESALSSKERFGRLLLKYTEVFESHMPQFAAPEKVEVEALLTSIQTLQSSFQVEK